jgi:RND family efflux transporter MFP subunit
LAQESVDLAPKLDGRVDEIHVRLGDHVDRGALVASLDTRSVRRDLAMGQAQLEAARAEVAKAELELADSQERLRRKQAPLQAGIQAVSGDELATAEFRYKQAGPGVEAARAHVAERQARVDQLKQTVEDSLLRAPFDGVVAARFVDPGAGVGPRTPLVRLISAHDLWVRFAAPEESAGTIAAGQRVSVRLAELGLTLDGVVEKVAPEIDAASRMRRRQAVDPVRPRRPRHRREVTRRAPLRYHAARARAP